MKLILAILIALFLTIPTQAGVVSTYWSCMQIGHLDSKPVLILSDLQTAKYSYKTFNQREKAFDKAVKKEWSLTDEYEPLCQNFNDKKEAKTIRKHITKKAQKSGLVVIPLKFKFGERNEEIPR